MAAAILVLELVGCAHRAPVYVIAPPKTKPDPGTVGLTIPPEGPEVILQRPATVGAGQGAKEGAKAGALAPLVPGAVVVGKSGGDYHAFVFGLALLAAGVVLAPAGAGVGAAVGALTAPSKNEVERSAAALERALADANLPNVLTWWIIDAGGQRPIIHAADLGGPNLDTLLEIDTPRVVLESKDPIAWRPNLRLRVYMAGRLLRASDHEELGAWSWEYAGPKATLSEWSGDDARLFRAELERAGRALATQVINDVY
jgi:hypothetical protein